ncbi:MAG: hypothetical protein HY287_05750 [Planctomycetes bacterium]|nr:hypothetical protein [Planctomycetota bacterium]MBI3833815.1 hypothetical protein [Planctomycetota bacterium]
MRTRTRRYSIVFVGVLGSAAARFVVADDVQSNLPSAHKAFPQSPPARLGAIEGFDDEAKYFAAMGRRADELIDSASSQPDTMKAASILAAANIVLSEQIEPFVSGKFLGIAASTSPDEVKAALDNVDEWLSLAPLSMRDSSNSSGDAKEKPEAEVKAAREIPRKLLILKAFAEALRVYVQPDADAHALRHAISALSVPLEDSSSEINAAARFWRACLQDREEKASTSPSSALLQPLESTAEVQPYTCFHRLLRSKRAAARGGYVSALASLIDARERAEQSFALATQKRQALRTIGQFRLHVLSEWYAHLDPASQTEERDWCADQAERIIAEQYKDEVGVLRIRPLIPIIAPAPKLDQPTRLDEPAGNKPPEPVQKPDRE